MKEKFWFLEKFTFSDLIDDNKLVVDVSNPGKIEHGPAFPIHPNMISAMWRGLFFSTGAFYDSVVYSFRLFGLDFLFKTGYYSKITISHREKGLIWEG